MIPWIRHLFTDQGTFVGYCRALLLVAGGAYATGQFAVPGVPGWVGVLAMGLAGMIRSSNAPPNRK